MTVLYVIILLICTLLCCSTNVQLCAYTVPHPSEKQINLRVQTNGRQTATEVLEEGLLTFRAMVEHVHDTFTTAVQDFQRGDEGAPMTTAE